MTRYSNLKDAVLDLDPLLIRTLAAFSIDESDEGHLVTFRFMLYGQHLEQEIADLDDCEILGSLNAARLAPALADAPAKSHRWVVKTHSGSQGERIEWRNSIY